MPSPSDIKPPVFEESEATAQPPAQFEPGGHDPLPQFDWLTEVAIPICVFGLLGSLLYYLIEVRASLAGPYSVGPLRWVVFWFLLACIGIARIRTKYGGAAIASYYSVLLAGAMALFVWVYTGHAGAFYGGVNQGRWLALLFNWSLVGVVWWAASAVTREATLEENVETQLEGGLWTLLAEEWQYPSEDARRAAAEADHARVRPRHPGRLVLWVSLVALVLFAVGQRTLGGESDHARVAFRCMAAYVLFALLLLALTNLSALRMQVRRRGISLAPAVSPAWIITSTIVVIAIVLFSSAMPRPPTPEGPLRLVVVPEWLTDSRRPGMEEGPAPGLGPQGRQPGGEEESAGAWHESEWGEPTTGDRGDFSGDGAREGSGREQQERGAGQGQGRGSSSSLRDHLGAPAGTSDLARLLLWLLLIAAGLAVAYFVWVHRDSVRNALRLLAHLPLYLGRGLRRLWERFRAWLARLGLPGRKGAGAERLPEDPFVDIFARGLDAKLPPAEVIRYVYRAFQVYAARGGCARRDDQTALEFLRALPAHLHLPDQAVERLTRAYVLATYSPHEVTPAQVEGARKTWLMMKQRLDKSAPRAAARVGERNRTT